MANPVDLEPQAKAVVDANANPPYLFELGPDQGRRTIDAVQSGPVKKLTVDVEDTTVPGGPSGQVSVRILRPQGIRRPLAVIVYLHGPGWVFGNHHTHDRLIRELAVGAQAAVVFPNYSLSPQAKYPTAIQECDAVARWVATHGLDHGLDPSRIAIAGDSVGGNLTAAVTLLANQGGGPVFRHQVLFYPVTDASFDTESYRQFATGYYLRRDAMQWSWDQYTTDPAQRAEPTASPLPPALVITAEADVVRDEGEAYADKLRDAGVAVTADRFPAIIHDFVMLNALADTNAARGAITLATDTLRAVLSDKP
jgi:acetyl esterase